MLSTVMVFKPLSMSGNQAAVFSIPRVVWLGELSGGRTDTLVRTNTCFDFYYECIDRASSKINMMFEYIG